MDILNESKTNKIIKLNKNGEWSWHKGRKKTGQSDRRGKVEKELNLNPEEP